MMWINSCVVLILLYHLQLTLAQVDLSLIGSCIEAGLTECCLDECQGLGGDCFCDDICLDADDCCRDIYQLDVCVNFAGTECTSGSVRLVGGLRPYEGLVEVCIFQSWHPVCNTSFSYPQALVACSQLGYSATLDSHTNTIQLDNTTVLNRTAYGADCSGNESRLTECIVDIRYCVSGDEQATVQCIPIDIIVCDPPCVNGVCEENNQCDCMTGWTGITCDNATCTPDCVNGECIEPDICDCDPGWTGDRCREDIDECFDNIAMCSDGCNNTLGSFYCYCDEGYILDSNDTTCEDINECDTDNGGCSHFCNNTDGSYSCSCPVGYELNGTFICQDINECNRAVLCEQVCINTDGSYYCDCQEGYRLGNDSSSCIEINECLEGLHNCSNETEICINTFGSFECQCITGYMKDNGVCNDINECDVLNGGCSHFCNNTNGSYYCSCPVGYELVNELLCVDIDECSNSSLNDCDQICMNTLGSFMCQCRDGYELVNDSCIVQECIEVLTSPSNGILECNSSVQVTHTRCITSCDIGYEVVGSAVRICQPDGTWSGESAYCQPLRCPTLFPPINGYVQLPCTTLYDSECFVRCFDGFKLVNGNGSVYCDLDENDEEIVQWTEYGVCNKTPVCGNNTCRHGGICSETSDNQFTCDCTGTLYQGRTCEQGLVIVSEISVLRAFKMSMITISARPDEELVVNFDDLCRSIGAGGGIMPNDCKPIIFTTNDTMIEVPLLPLGSGLVEFRVTLSGSNSRDYVQPQSIPVVVVGQEKGTPYFDKVGNDTILLTRSCCPSGGVSELMCPGLNTGSIAFNSSCDWEMLSGSLLTGGIVFSSFKGFHLPISITGLSISGNRFSILDRGCGSCPGLIPLNAIPFSNSQDQVCYLHKPTISDVTEFVSKQSLETTFISTIQDSLFPTWLRLSVPSNDRNQTFNFEQSDLLVDILKEVDVANNVFCPRMIIDSTGYFALLLHNGPLKVELQSSMNSYETQDFMSPPSGFYYCVGVNLCSPERSLVYIGIPPSAQSAIRNISFISECVDKGWDLNFLSIIIRNIDDPPAETVSMNNYWNGVTPNYNPPIPQPDISVNMEASGQFEHGDTSVTIEFLGNYTYQYATEMNETIIAIARGEHTVTITTILFGEEESLELEEILNTAFIYYQENIPSCTTENTPGIAWKLTYRPQPSQDFYLNLLSLPFDTPNCPVDVFLNLDSDKDMNGLSFYSTCLIIKYDELLFVDLTHKFYIPLDSETLCTSVNLTNQFPDYQSFGLLIHSTFPQTQSMGIPLGSFFRLLSGSDNIAVSFGFSSCNESKVGLLHSVDITVLGTTFNSQLVLQDSELSFMGSADIFGDVIYFAHMMGRGESLSTWDDLDINIMGWFPRENGKIQTKLEDSVHIYLEQIAASARDRLDEAEQQLEQSLRRFNDTKKAHERALQIYRNASEEYNQTVQQHEDANMSLILAQNSLENATGELQNAEIALSNLCQIETCPLMCVPMSKNRIVFDDVFDSVIGECDSVCTETQRVRVAPFSVSTVSWRFTEVCRTQPSICNGNPCNQIVCRYLCLSFLDVKTVNNFRVITVTNPCRLPCETQVLNKTIQSTEQYIDPCGERVPDTNCTNRNNECELDRSEVLDLIESTREGLTEPIRLRNNAQQMRMLAWNQVIRAGLNRDVAKLNLEAAQLVFSTAEALKTISENNYQSVNDSISQGLKAYELMNSQNLTLHEIFNITNITFNVNLRIQTPVVFPIDVHFESSQFNQVSVISLLYNFQTSFDTQKDFLNEGIVNILFSSNRKKRFTGRMRRAEPQRREDLGQEQFEIRCIQLMSVLDYLEHIKESLLEARATKENVINDLSTLMDQLNSFKVIEDTNTTVDYSSLQLLFNITTEEIEESIRTSPTSTENEQVNSILDIIRQIESTARDDEAAIDNTLFVQWQATMELLQENRTIGENECYGFSDCLLVLLDVLQSLAEFGPLTIREDLLSHIESAMNGFVQLATNSSLSIDEALSNVEVVLLITKGMEENGYWCARAPEIITHPIASANVSVGGMLQLTCEGDSILPLRYQWKKDGVAITGRTENVLVVTNFQIFDEGNYSCEISNAVETVQSTNSSVLAFVLPEFYLTPVSITTYIGDQNGALFTCNATSRPDPGWIWYFRKDLEDEWKEIEGQEVNELLILQPNEDDIGLYMCLAYNYHGNISSDYVSLQLLSATARVVSYEVSFSMTTRNVSETQTAKRAISDVEETLLSLLEENLNIEPNMLTNVVVDELNRVSMVLIAANTTINGTSRLPLIDIFDSIRSSEENLDSLLTDLRNFVTSGSLVFVIEDEEYSYSQSSYTVNLPRYLCPAGQELHSNTLLCVDCLEGQHQITIMETRFISGSVIRESVPRCVPCPLNTYQSEIGGPMCTPCPEGHITLSTGSTSEEQCIRDCPVEFISEVCEDDPCLLEACPAFPNAECIIDDCGVCTARWFDNGKELTEEQCRQCPLEGQVYKNCINNCPSTCSDLRPSCDTTTCPNPGCECTDGEVLDSEDGKCIPRKDCDICSLSVNVGPCEGLFPRWYFDSESGKCERFAYGGCDGNDNRFTTLTDCINTCGCGPLDSIQCISNPCDNSVCPAYPNAVCEVDTCGDCSARYYNNELTEVTDMCEICRLPALYGLCQGSTSRFFFNELSGRCEPFTYSGCGGNRNNFETLNDCIEECGDVCLPGEELANCLVNPCEVTFCPQYPNANCIPDYCGGCNAIFYDESGRDVTELCVQCPEDTPVLRCGLNYCNFLTCPESPDAECIMDVCGQCEARFYMNDEEVTDSCTACPAEGQIFKPCISSCQYTCESFGRQIQCSDDCTAGCDCPDELILDEMNNQCVMPSECPCPACDPLPNNCTNVVQPSGEERCGCPQCRDCPIEGQVYQDCQPCPLTCTQLDKICSTQCIPGCGCPEGQVIDEQNNKCILLRDCEFAMDLKPDPCTLPMDQGICPGNFQRYFYNTVTQRCEIFFWGGCFGNDNKFNSLHDCEEMCSTCPPTCTPRFCVANRRSICTIPQSVSDDDCPGGCVISNCQACYYSYIPLPFPMLDPSCPSFCINDGNIDEECLNSWGRCVQRGYSRTYPRLPSSARIPENYNCWSHPCSQD